MRTPEILIVTGLAGCLPPDEPARPKPIVDPDIAQLAHPWTIDAHVLSIKTTLSDADAGTHHGRAVTVGAASYTTPWHGTCEEANREKRTRRLAEVTADLDLSPPAVAVVRKFGFPDSTVVEYHLSCKEAKTRVPALTIYVGTSHAMTCFGGACYLLRK